jgi:hypothetical protein
VLDQHKEKKPSDPTIREKFDTYRFADYKERVIDLLGASDARQRRNRCDHRSDARRQALIVRRDARATSDDRSPSARSAIQPSASLHSPRPQPFVSSVPPSCPS